MKIQILVIFAVLVSVVSYGSANVTHVTVNDTSRKDSPVRLIGEVVATEDESVLLSNSLTTNRHKHIAKRHPACGDENRDCGALQDQCPRD